MKRLLLSTTVLVLVSCVAIPTATPTTTPATSLPPDGINVRDFGATGDGLTNDTAAIQAASNAARDAGGDTVLFPAGVYRTATIDVFAGNTYQGAPGAVLRRLPGPMLESPRWTRTFTTHRRQYSGMADSAPLVIRGLTFDGNSAEQGAYQDWELEHAAQVFLMASSATPGRLRATVEDCVFMNGVGDGVQVHTNADVTLRNLTAENVFRGGFVLTGGHSSVLVENLTTYGDVDAGGIDIEVDGPGYGGTLRVNVSLHNLDIRDGDFEIAVYDGSIVTGSNIVSRAAPFHITARESTVYIRDSAFTVEPINAPYGDWILAMHRVTFERVRFNVGLGTGLWLRWQYSGMPVQTDQRLVFNACEFRATHTEAQAGLFSGTYNVQPGDALVINGGCFDAAFVTAVKVGTGSVAPVGAWGVCR